MNEVKGKQNVEKLRYICTYAYDMEKKNDHRENVNTYLMHEQKKKQQQIKSEREKT